MTAKECDATLWGDSGTSCALLLLSRLIDSLTDDKVPAVTALLPKNPAIVLAMSPKQAAKAQAATVKLTAVNTLQLLRRLLERAQSCREAMCVPPCTCSD